MENNSLIKQIGCRLAEESGHDAEVVSFGLNLFVSTIATYAVLIIFAAVLGVLPYALTVAVTASLFRTVMGGAHASSPVRCGFIGLVVCLLFGYLGRSCSNFEIMIFLPLALIIGLYVTHKYVPAEAPGKPINSQIQKTYLRVLTLGLLLIWGLSGFFFRRFIPPQIIASSYMGLGWQLFTITPVGFWLMREIDTKLSLLTERRRKK